MEKRNIPAPPFPKKSDQKVIKPSAEAFENLLPTEIAFCKVKKDNYRVQKMRDGRILVTKNESENQSYKTGADAVSALSGSNQAKQANQAKPKDE